MATAQSRTALSVFTLVHALFLMIGSGAGLLLRVYFIHGGKRIWLSTLLQIAGWPLLLIPLLITSRRFQLSVWMYAVFSILGVLFAVDCYFYALAWEYLPLSTSSLLVSSQLGFTAVFAFLIVRQRFTPYSFNAVVLLTVGPVVMSMGADSDRPEGESKGKYVLGFVMAVVAAALCGPVGLCVDGACHEEGQGCKDVCGCDGDAACHGRCWYGVLPRWHGRQQRLSGNTERSKGVRPRENEVLHGSSLGRSVLAAREHRSGRSHIRRFIAVPLRDACASAAAR